MQDDTELIQELGIEQLTPEQQHNIIDELNMQVGEAMAEKLTADQLEEFQQIIDGNSDVITAWLEANDPDYRETEAYKQIAQDTEQGDDPISADKIYAYLAWVEVNNPALDETVAKIKTHIKANIDSYK